MRRNNFIHHFFGGHVDFFDIGNESVGIAGNAAGLHGFAIKFTNPWFVWSIDDGIHEFIGHAHRNIEIADIAFDLLAVDEVENIRMIHAQDCHVGAVAALLFDYAEGLVVNLEKEIGPEAMPWDFLTMEPAGRRWVNEKPKPEPAF
jgi:hypothetical protein